MEAQRPPFDSLTIGFHWATVLLVLAMFTSARWRSHAQDHVHEAILLWIHRSIGATIWVTTVFRLSWRLTNAKLPPFPADMGGIHRAPVKVSEYSLHTLLLGQPITAFLATLSDGRSFALLLWQIPQLMPKDRTLQATFYFAHHFGAWALAILISGHAAAALVHHFLLRDDVLQCMAPVTAPKRHKHALLPRPRNPPPSFARESQCLPH